MSLVVAILHNKRNNESVANINVGKSNKLVSLTGIPKKVVLTQKKYAMLNPKRTKP